VIRGTPEDWFKFCGFTFVGFIEGPLPRGTNGFDVLGVPGPLRFGGNDGEEFFDEFVCDPPVVGGANERAVDPGLFGLPRFTPSAFNGEFGFACKY